MHYHGGKNAKAQGDTRTYVHAIPDQRLHAEYEDFVACGCRGWSMVADELEGKIKDLILAERGIGCYEDEVRAALAEQEKVHRSGRDAVAAARADRDYRIRV